MNKSLLSMLVGAAFAGVFATRSYAVEPGAAAAEPETLLSMDDIMNMSVDDVEDAPEFISPPDGDYILKVGSCKLEEYKTTDKESGADVKKKRIKIIYEVFQVNSLADAEDAPPAAKSLFSEQFMTNADGLSYFKRQARNILGAEVIKGATIGELVKNLPSAPEFHANVKTKRTERKVEGGKPRIYENVQVRVKGAADLELGDDSVSGAGEPVKV